MLSTPPTAAPMLPTFFELSCRYRKGPSDFARDVSQSRTSTSE
jgi:hypothetical protein